MKLNSKIPLTIIGLSGLPLVSQAATISWASSENLYQGATVETFVSTNGTSAVAYNATNTVGGSVTVNTVPFLNTQVGSAATGAGGESITLISGATNNNPNAFQDGEFTSNTDVFNLIASGSWALNSVSFAGLTANTIYEIQVFNNDARGNRHLDFVTGYSDGVGTVPVAFSELNNSPVNGDAPTFPQTDAGDSIIGTFTADGATQSFDIFGRSNAGSNFATGNSQSQINAIQLRVIGTVPEPSSALLSGVALLGLLRRRR